MSGALSALSPGFADPSHDAQQLFREVLDAFSHPGRIVTLADVPQGPGTISPATAAYLLTLADRDTSLWLAPAFNTPEVRDYLRFHAGVPIVEDRAAATFAVLPHDDANPFEGFAIGTDTYPDRSATLVIEVPALGTGPTTSWTRPGHRRRGPVRDRRTGRPVLAGNAPPITRSSPAGWTWSSPQGPELLALPRSIAVEV
jgi:alpha-D-ribose 1-methylphosphonate 5-triphosphate synthase subunit PhnH